MYYEKGKLIFRRIFWLLAIIVFTVICVKTIDEYDAQFEADKTELQIVNDDVVIDDEYDSITSCAIYVTFNKPVKPGYIAVSLYDKDGATLYSNDVYFSSKLFAKDRTVLSANVYCLDVAEYYELGEFDIEPYNYADDWAVIYLIGLILLVLCLLSALFYNAKKYFYDGNEVIVYAGLFHNYIKINGEKEDYKNTFGYIFIYLLLPFVCFLIVVLIPIRLSATINRNTYNANISVFNRIKLKINNRLYNKNREFKNQREYSRAAAQPANKENNANE